MSFISLPLGKLHKKTETKKLKNFPAGYFCKFYRNLADNVDSSLVSDFYGRIANDADIPRDNVQKNLLATYTYRRCVKVSLGIQ